jgi:hypothetical protein
MKTDKQFANYLNNKRAICATLEFEYLDEYDHELQSKPVIARLVDCVTWEPSTQSWVPTSANPDKFQTIAADKSTAKHELFARMAKYTIARYGQFIQIQSRSNYFAS